jgi:hypothetical protein
MGSGGWRIDVGVNESVYDYLNKRRIKTIKERFERHIQKEMSMIFPFTFEVFIVLDV